MGTASVVENRSIAAELQARELLSDVLELVALQAPLAARMVEPMVEEVRGTLDLLVMLLDDSERHVENLIEQIRDDEE